ncbi:MAG: hypothetical protein K6C94_06980 [Candidatus Gastranaerophilales bacterium]|nr:hypothetical protein [Candidatus Gastranaerophilales bacterium]
MNTDDIKKYFDNLKKDFNKEIKALKQNFRNKPEQTITLKFDDNFANSPYQKELELMQKNIERLLYFQNTENAIKQNISDPEKQNAAMSILSAYKEADGLSLKVSEHAKDITDSFAAAIAKLIDGTEDFDTVMKHMLADLQQTLFKALSSAVINKLLSSTAEQQAFSVISNLTSFSGNAVSTGLNFTFDFLKNLFGSHHSGGLVPNGTGNIPLPNTKEYLSVLKGGEKVLSPAETASLDNNYQKNFVINNFNVKAWDSKDVRKYLIDNKDVLAGISVENIKCNNSNLRQTILGM